MHQYGVAYKILNSLIYQYLGNRKHYFYCRTFHLNISTQDVKQFPSRKSYTFFLDSIFLSLLLDESLN